MWFLLKGSFWFSAVLLALPLLDEAPQPTVTAGAAPAAKLEVGETLSALATAIADFQAICERRPDVCVTGSETLTALGLRARDGARLAYGYLDTALASDTALADAAPSMVEADPLATGGVQIEIGMIGTASTGAELTSVESIIGSVE